MTVKFLRAFAVAFAASMLTSLVWIPVNFYVPLYRENPHCRYDPDCGGGPSHILSGRAAIIALAVFLGAFYWSYGQKDRYMQTLLLFSGIALLLAFFPAIWWYLALFLHGLHLM